MRRHRALGLTVAGLTGTLGLTVPAWADTPTTLYVNNTPSASCSDGGSGTKAQPFCSVPAAAAVAGPGQTVEIAAGAVYPEQVVLTRSGEPGRPITFRGGGNGPNVQASGSTRTAVVVTGAHDVVLANLSANGGVSVTGSDRITLDGVWAFGRNAQPAVDVSGGSHDVAVVRGVAGADRPTPAVRITGSSGTLVGRVQNRYGWQGPLVSAVDAPDTTIVNNGGTSGCGSGAVVSGDSPRAIIVNNIFTSSASTVCTAADKGPLISVSASAAGTAHVRYNVLRSESGAALYSWAGTEYTTVADYRAATGEGTADVVVPTGANPAGNLSPATDSADTTVAGIPTPDRVGGLPADDPRVANTGTGHGYLDRGPIELQAVLDSVTVAVDEAWAPYGTTVTATAAPVTNWPGAPIDYTFDFGDGTKVTTQDAKASHTYTAACSCQVTVTAANPGSTSSRSGSTAVKVTEAGELRAALAVRKRPVGTDDSNFHVSPLSVEAQAFDTVLPWPVAGATFDFGDGTAPQSFTALQWVGHVYAAPGDYVVTVTVRDVKGGVSTTSTTHHVAYAQNAYTAAPPFRLLDTRSGAGALKGGSSLTLDVSTGFYKSDGSRTGLSPEAVVLNVTATKATADTFVTLWPSGQTRPTVSSLNVKAGRTVANLVTVPVGADGKVRLYNHAGQSDVIVDFVGSYQRNTGDQFAATAPTRLSDTTLAGGAIRTIKVTGAAGVPVGASAVVVNLTAASPTAGGFLTAYPHGSTPPTVSSLNFAAGQTVANQAIVPIGVDGSIDVYNLTGTTRVVVDVVGYYRYGSKGWFTPTVPVRLIDTRYDGAKAPLGAGATLGLPVGGTHGVPADATTAVLNVTAVQPTTAGYLTVWPHGAGRPATSNLNFGAGQTVPNHVTAQLGAGGAVDVYNFSGSTHVIADLAGWFSDWHPPYEG